VRAATPARCPRCGSAFLLQHRCAAPWLGEPDCARCGHPHGSHHRTDAGNYTYCTVWGIGPQPADPPPRGLAVVQCPCDPYLEP